MADRLSLEIARLWDGRDLPNPSRTALEIHREGGSLVVELDAAFHNDPPPDHPPGPTSGLWNHEVVELFVAGPGERYLEIELGPWGHHWVLQLDGVRQPTREGLAIDWSVSRKDGRFSGRARVGLDLLPEPPWRVNAFAIHAASCVGEEARCHHAHAAVPGSRPDFHRLDCFVAAADL